LFAGSPTSAKSSSVPKSKKPRRPHRETRPKFLLALSLLLPMPAVAGFLMLFGSGGNPRAAQLIGIIFAEQEVPLFAAFQNFLFLRGDFFADFNFDFFFLALFSSLTRFSKLAIPRSSHSESIPSFSRNIASGSIALLTEYS